MKYQHSNHEFSVQEPAAAYAAKTVSIHEAKTSLSRLVKRAAAGETIYIGAYGKPDVALTAVNQKKINAELRAQAFGCMKGKITFHEGWDDPLPDDIIESFYSMQGLEDFEKK
jgi:antitoxin (DNA-binding transcriptional repressor) of toxin-antitoxin stability system